MKTPSAVIFDLGKVLVDFDYSIAARRIAARSTVPADQVQRFIDHSALLVRFETGRLTTAQFFQEVRAATGFTGELDDFCHYFADIFVPIEPMVDLHALLRRRGVPTYIFSNTNDLAVGHIRRSFPFFIHFEGYIYSYEHGVMKPDPGLYEVVERESGHRGAELLYLDDRAENVAAGAARGWQVILHHTAEASRSAVQQLGLLG